MGHVYLFILSSFFSSMIERKNKKVYIITNDYKLTWYCSVIYFYYLASSRAAASALALFQNDDGSTFVLSHRSWYFPAILTTSSRRPTSNVIGLRPRLQNFLLDTYSTQSRTIMITLQGRWQRIIFFNGLAEFGLF